MYSYRAHSRLVRFFPFLWISDINSFRHVNTCLLHIIPSTIYIKSLVYSSPGRNRIYIMTLGVLAAYRNHGIGSKLVTSVLDYIETEKNGKQSTVDEIMLHVQTSNVDAIKFYEEKFGFKKGALVENYYKRIDPPHCYILRKEICR